MNQQRVIRVHLRPGILGWALAVAVFLLAIVIAVFAVGILLLAVPVLIATALIQYFVWRWRFRRALRQRMKESPVIDGTYRVVDPEREPQPPSHRLT